MKLTIENDNMKISLDTGEHASQADLDRYLGLIYGFLMEPRPKLTLEEVAKVCGVKVKEDDDNVIRTFNEDGEVINERTPWTETHAEQLRSEMKRLDITQSALSEATDIPIWRIRKYVYRHYKTIATEDLVRIKGVLNDD